MKFKFLLITAVAALVIFLTVNGSNKAGRTVQEDHFPNVMRLIGHQLLLSTGDSQSRVMPIIHPTAKRYRISFEKNISIEPDSLFQITRHNTTFYNLPENYTVNVLDCVNHEVVYSFVMSGVDSTMVVSCLGRTLPEGCYYIDIDFSGSATLSSGTLILLLGASLLLLLISISIAVYFYQRNKKARSAEKDIMELPSTVQGIKIGDYIFNIGKRSLTFSGDVIPLTDKEEKLLSILSASPNTVIDRDYLQQEIWGKQGVIVTRSLDVFVSRLRKKLEKDQGVKIINVHGKGYKLDMPVS
ncbi:MAG TPA: winged helix-turn-helix domain-containing protein [Chitinophagaceae bacterium]